MIDAHVHLWDPAARELAGATLEPLRRAYTVDELRRHAAAAGARRDHVAVKLSGLITEAAWDSWAVDDLAPVAEHVLDSFGSSRVMFGSDWPVCELAASYDDVVSVAAQLFAALSSDERTDVLERTAARVYGL